MVKEAPEALAEFETHSVSVFPISVKQQIQEHKLPNSREHVDQAMPGTLAKFTRQLVSQVSPKSKGYVHLNSSTNFDKCGSIAPEAMPNFCQRPKFRKSQIPNTVKILGNGSAKAGNIK
jgi:hypothetical protein